MGTIRDDLAARKAVHAVKLRAQHLTYDEIAQALLPCSPEHQPDGKPWCDACVPMYGHRSSAKRAVDAQLAQEYAAGSETREQQRRQQLAEIDLILARLIPQAIGHSAEQQEAARSVVRYLDRRAKLLGLDAPARVQITTEMDAQIEALADQLLSMPGGVPTEAVD
jgi:hypothetical protein